MENELVANSSGNQLQQQSSSLQPFRLSEDTGRNIARLKQSSELHTKAINVGHTQTPKTSETRHCSIAFILSKKHSSLCGDLD
jgi:hypothetical protein